MILRIFTLLALTGISIGSAQQTSFDHSHQSLTQVLKTYVNGNGMVNYGKLKQNRAGLDRYLGTTASVSQSAFNTWSKPQQLAFLINVYNAETLQLIIDHHPVDSIKKIGKSGGSPWKLESVDLFGGKTTLDHLEHGIIRANHIEPRVHFALVCGAVSCPPLRAEAFNDRQLESQLNNQTVVFLNQREKNRVDGRALYLSPIFKWFKGDFTKSSPSIAHYVDPYYSDATANKKVKFTDYSWALNQQ